MPSIAQVVLTVPSLIGGRPDLTFETGSISSIVTLQAPEGILARSATVDLMPLSPADQQSPPFSFAIDTLAQNNNLTIPTNSVWLSGTLHDAVDHVPSRPFVARAFQQGRLVSNLSVIAASGGAAPMARSDWQFLPLPRRNLSPSRSGPKTRCQRIRGSRRTTGRSQRWTWASSPCRRIRRRRRS